MLIIWFFLVTVLLSWKHITYEVIYKFFKTWDQENKIYNIWIKNINFAFNKTIWIKKMDTNEQLTANETKKNEGCFKKLRKLFEKSTKETG